MKLSINNYPGSKNASGLSELIINNTPAFIDYYELFGGSAVIAEKLYDHNHSGHYVINELCCQVFDQLSVKFINHSRLSVHNLCYKQWLIGLLNLDHRDKAFVYLDPPYTKESRRSGRDIYNHEFSMIDHFEFLDILTSKELPFYCMVSHYPCELYDTRLSKWFKKTIQVQTRKGLAIEAIYMNYDISKLPLQSYQYIGENFTDRQRIKRYQSNLIRKIDSLPFHEKHAILQYIQNKFF